jgi:D-3-phosphoglycerate dehydrogenase
VKIAVLDDYQRVVTRLDAWAKVKDMDVTVFGDIVTDLEALIARLRPFDTLVPTRGRTRLEAALLEALPNLRHIIQTGHAVEHIDLAACRRLGIRVAASGSAVEGAAELTFALILAASRDLVGQSLAMRAGHWQTFCGRRLAGRTLGIVGFGKIGARVAGYAKAFGMEVIALGDRPGSRQRALDAGHAAVASKREVFERCDVVVLQQRLTPETRHGIALDDLLAMRADAMLVNTARAELIAPGALLEALRQGRPGFAALDVFENEPLTDTTHPLLNMSNVLCTPHLGFAERDTLEHYYGLAFDQLRALAGGQPIQTLDL